MRLALAFALTLPTTALADVFTVASAPTAVTVYSEIARVTREITLDLHAGQHDIILPDLPGEQDSTGVRIAIEGATLRGRQISQESAPLGNDSPVRTAAKERVKAAEEALQALEDRIETARLVVQAAEAKMAFLVSLGESDALPSDVETLRALTQMIGGETLTAQQETLSAEQTARRLGAERDLLESELKAAHDALRELREPPDWLTKLTISVTAPEAVEASLTVTYFVPAFWVPEYDIYLAGDAPNNLSIRRKATVFNPSEEEWKDVTLTLSTFPVTDRTSPSSVYPEKLTFVDRPPAKPAASLRATELDLSDELADPIIEMPVIVEERASMLVSVDGPGVTYTVPEPVTLLWDTPMQTVELDIITFDARQFARAVPRSDDTAFLMAAFTNDTQEPLLAPQAAYLYLDNVLIGQTRMDAVPAGAEAELAFGAIQELQLEYTVLDQSEGDRGIISRTNAKTEQTRLDIQNIGSDDWEVEVRSAVPHAVQEDLVIDWTATPAPNSESVNDKIGVLQWDISVSAGTTSSIVIDKDIRWPEGKILQQR